MVIKRPTHLYFLEDYTFHGTNKFSKFAFAIHRVIRRLQLKHVLLLILTHTVGRNKKRIEEYIRNQLQEDHASDQITLKEYYDPFDEATKKK
jgi:hypothetical protein